MGRFKDTQTSPNQVLFELGLAFEDVVAGALAARVAQSQPDRYLRPGEFLIDGIACTPDLIDLIEWMPLEVKLTSLSSRHDPASTKFWHWWTQIKAYSKAIDSLKGQLHVCHYYGDYAGSGPVYHVWEEEWSREEIDETWRMICRHR